MDAPSPEQEDTPAVSSGPGARNRKRTPVPGRWAYPLVARFFTIAPRRFCLLAFLDVSVRYINIASFMIPIKLLFLATQGVTEIPIPGTGTALSLGRMEITLIVIPLGALTLVNRFVRKLSRRRKNDLSDRLWEISTLDKKTQKNMGKQVVKFSQAITNLSLSTSCILVMAIFVPDVAVILGGCVIVALLIARHRITAFYAHEDALAKVGQELSEEEVEEKVKRISANTQAGLQMVLLPAFVYFVSGAIMRGELGAVGAMAFLFLFRWFVRAGQSFSAGITDFLHAMSREPKLQAAVRSGVFHS